MQRIRHWCCGFTPSVLYRSCQEIGIIGVPLINDRLPRFAHAPSKVRATIDAVKQQYPDRKLIAVLELHTHSSLNEQFMQEYSKDGTGRWSCCIFIQVIIALKRLPELPAESVCRLCQRRVAGIYVRAGFVTMFKGKRTGFSSNLLLMSSGNYDGTDMLTFAKSVTQ